jgi:NAD(P)-dependent dehydrogenase (short-subunit alcohol dehydrogenase family)
MPNNGGMTHSFHDQIALVTGGSTGIGAATARLLAERGARVVITGRTKATLDATAAGHPNITAVVADVALPDDVARVVERVKALGRLDVLVNNAGKFELAPLAESNPEHVRTSFDTNVFGLVEMTRQALPLLAKSKGAIVNIASTVADEPFAGLAVYCATKAAVLALTRSWAQELAAVGIRVNACSPGPIETPIFDPAKMHVTAEQAQQLGTTVLGLVPVQRFGKPEEVAQVVAFLASREASFVTGAQYSVGGGIEA